MKRENLERVEESAAPPKPRRHDEHTEKVKQAVIRIEREFGNGRGNSFEFVGPGGMWKWNAVHELMMLAYEEGSREVGNAG